jgi:hypothetical protein
VVPWDGDALAALDAVEWTPHRGNSFHGSGLDTLCQSGRMLAFPGKTRLAMLRRVLTFLVLALIAALLGSTDIAA